MKFEAEILLIIRSLLKGLIMNSKINVLSACLITAFAVIANADVYNEATIKILTVSIF